MRRGDDILVAVDAGDGLVYVAHTPEEYARYHKGLAEDLEPEEGDDEDRS